MALSNAIVPLLPIYSEGQSLQGAIYAAYFFGAFALTLPAGILADRYGRITVMRYGLFITVPSGILLVLSTDPSVIIAARLIEGAGAGLFVAAAMAYINSLPDHELMSGYYMASLNMGLVLGLVVSGVLAVHSADLSGISLFTVACLFAALLSLSLSDHQIVENSEPDTVLARLVYEYRWFWFAAIVLIGITGVVTSLYPAFSPAAPDIDSIWIAGMSISTVLISLIVSRLPLEPVRTIRTGGVVMAAGVILMLCSPTGFIVIGAAAGIVMIAQMNFLSRTSAYQGAVMGLYSTTSYLGMGILPFLSGILTDLAGYTITFFLVACAALAAILMIGKPSGRKDAGEQA